MNKLRRNTLNKAADLLSEASGLVESVLDEEQECMENMPENLQSSERYEAMEQAVDLLSSALDSISEASDNISEAVNG